MQGKYILLVLMVFLLLVPLGEATTKKITAGSPVFIGESDVDIFKALDNCQIIAWWPEGAEKTSTGARNITIRPLNEVSNTIYHYTFSPGEYSNYTGNWYCEGRQPLKVVFVVNEPQMKIRVWDLDEDKDVTGTTIPLSANITYRIDTNLDAALNLKNRYELNPVDSFFTVSLSNPRGMKVTNIYTGNDGAADTKILTLENKPMVSRSPYLWKDGSSWDRTSRSSRGERLYSEGTYTFTASQDLNGMQAIYKAAGITDTDGKLTSSAEVTFMPEAALTPSATQTTAIPVETGVVTASVATTVPATNGLTTPSPAATAPPKSTYAPLPAWIALAGLALAGAFVIGQRK